MWGFLLIVTVSLLLIDVDLFVMDLRANQLELHVISSIEYASFFCAL